MVKGQLCLLQKISEHTNSLDERLSVFDEQGSSGQHNRLVLRYSPRISWLREAGREREVQGDSRVFGPSLCNDEIIIHGDVQTKGQFYLLQVKSVSSSEISGGPHLLCEVSPALLAFDSRSCWLTPQSCPHPFHTCSFCFSHARPIAGPQTFTV